MKNGENEQEIKKLKREIKGECSQSDIVNFK